MQSTIPDFDFTCPMTYSTLMQSETGSRPEEREPAAELAPYVSRGTAEALARIKERFEDADARRNPHDLLAYHGHVHTENVMRRVATILRAIADADPSLVGERDGERGRLAGAFHDVAQEYGKKEERGADGGIVKLMRERRRGANEAASVQEALSFMEETNTGEGKTIFSEEDMRVVAEAIGATVPAYDARRNTVIQPALNEGSHIVARALALADLGGAGMDGARHFRDEGAAEFRELNLDIADALAGRARGEPITDERKAAFAQRMAAWFASQPDFARGRKVLLEQELAGLPEAVREALKTKVFAKFDESIAAADERAAAAKAPGASFEDLASLMGY